MPLHHPKRVRVQRLAGHKPGGVFAVGHGAASDGRRWPARVGRFDVTVDTARSGAVAPVVTAVLRSLLIQIKEISPPPVSPKQILFAGLRSSITGDRQRERNINC